MTGTKLVSSLFPLRFKLQAGICLILPCLQLSCTHNLKADAPFTSPSRQSLEISHDPGQNADVTISRTQAQTDIDTLLYMLHNGYSGASHMPPKDFELGVSKLQELRHSLPDTITSIELGLKIGAAIAAIPDRHLTVRFKGQPLAKRPPLVGGVGGNFGKQDSQAWEINRLKLEDGQVIPVLSIHKFPTSDDAAWNGYRAAVLKALKTSRALVIDLRGNDGGDDSQGQWLADTLWGGHAPTPYSKTYECRTVECLTAFLNMLHVIGFKYKNDHKTIPTSLADLERQYDQNLELAKNGKLSKEEIIPTDTKAQTPFDPKSGYNHPVYILADRKCVSSGESSLAMIRMHPRVKFIGENTGGLIHFGNQGLFELPNSGVEIRLGTHFEEDYQKRYFEMDGYQPDIRVPVGTDALDVLQKELRRELLD